MEQKKLEANRTILKRAIDSLHLSVYVNIIKLLNFY